ncbi:MAG TPA: serine hydrolase domain-containing protein, partial [Anaeromyxobacteraceae bacterium]|nr:serine hydrolase domain-containing protein [Anaeromyxobacteraceae bacterium]
RIERSLRPPVSLEGGERWTLAERMKHHGVPGVSIAIVQGGRIVATRAYGLADRQAGTAMRTDTPMQAASISKAVTAFAAMRMVERGQLGLDSPVNERLASWRIPETPATRARPITLAQLLGHTGGLGVHGYGGYEAGKPLPGILQILDGKPPANSPAVRVEQAPGAGFRYSGGGYTVAQLLMSEVAGQPFPGLMRREVLVPVGMRDSTFEFPLPARLAKRAAAGVMPDGKDVPGRSKVHPESAAAGLWTTPGDLARFAIEVQRAVRGESRLLGRAPAERMLRDPGPDHYGLGFAIVHENGAAYFGHDGWNDGFSSHLIANREGDGVAILINANQPQLMHELRRAVAFELGWPGYRTEKR